MASPRGRTDADTWAESHRFGTAYPFDTTNLSRTSRSDGPRRTRGVHLIHFADGSVHLGVSTRNCAARLHTHETRWDDCTHFRVLPVPDRRTALTPILVELLADAEESGVRVRNRHHGTHFAGDAALDALVDPDLQAEWLTDPVGVTTEHDVGIHPRRDTDDGADPYGRLLRRDDSAQLVSALALFLRMTVPLPRATVGTFWSVDCLPPADRSVLFSVALGGTRALSITADDGDVVALLAVDRAMLPTNRVRRALLLRRWGVHESEPDRVHDAGSDPSRVLLLRIRGRGRLLRVLRRREIAEAAASIGLELLRAGRGRPTTAHSPRLAEAALTSIPSSRGSATYWSAARQAFDAPEPRVVTAASDRSSNESSSSASGVRAVMSQW